MNEAEVAAVCEVGHSRGKRIAAHARSAESVKMCVRNGVQIVYHATLSDEEALDMLEAAKDWVFVVADHRRHLHDAVRGGGIRRQAARRRQAGAASTSSSSAADNMKKLKRRGVRVLPGGDYGFAWNPIGRNARDLEHFVNLLGYSADGGDRRGDAGSAAQIMMKGDELGEVKEGYLADLLLVDGDPGQGRRASCRTATACSRS